MNHSLDACDSFTLPTLTLGVLYVLVALRHRDRRLLRWPRDLPIELTVRQTSGLARAGAFFTSCEPTAQTVTDSVAVGKLFHPKTAIKRNPACRKTAAARVAADFTNRRSKNRNNRTGCNPGRFGGVCPELPRSPEGRGRGRRLAPVNPHERPDPAGRGSPAQGKQSGPIAARVVGFHP